MKIEKREIRIGDIVEGYIDNEERVFSTSLLTPL